MSFPEARLAVPERSRTSRLDIRESFMEHLNLKQEPQLFLPPIFNEVVDLTDVADPNVKRAKIEKLNKGVVLDTFFAFIYNFLVLVDTPVLIGSLTHGFGGLLFPAFFAFPHLFWFSLLSILIIRIPLRIRNMALGNGIFGTSYGTGFGPLDILFERIPATQPSPQA